MTERHPVQCGRPVVDPKSGWITEDGVVFVDDPRLTDLPPGGGRSARRSGCTTCWAPPDGQVLASLDREALEDAYSWSWPTA